MFLVDGFAAKTEEDLNSVAVQDGDFALTQLAKTINTPRRNQLIVEKWKQFAKGRHSTLVFAVNVQHIFDLQNAFKQENIDARVVYGETPKEERTQIVSAFRERKFPVLINCGVFTEGTDLN